MADIGEHRDAKAASADACALASNCGDSTVRRSGRVMSPACLWLFSSCRGTCGKVSSDRSWLVSRWPGSRERCWRSSMCGWYDAVELAAHSKLDLVANIDVGVERVR